ncbi:MFS family permease [Crossiella equi]|uniref:MFS family permease n=1 Tax=Crossiella equi TaxID=130796 RepID=A0ABS5A655_9PSEU|nr:MFS family permease [Crossiella equi]
MALGRDFGWLWAAYGVSAFGTRLAFDALTILAVLVLHADPAQVSLISAVGLAVGAVAALPLGPWVEFRHKRPVMVGMDLLRCATVLSVPAAHLAGVLTLGQLFVVSAVVAAADIAFLAASGAHLKALVPRNQLLVANGRFEATQWTATSLGPPLGGWAVTAFGPVTAILADAVSYLLSALGIRAIRAPEPVPAPSTERLRARDVLDGWRYILGHARLRPLFVNTVAVNALIMAPAPVIAVLMLRDLGFPPWQYGLAFALPCLGGLLGARLAPRAVARFGERRVLRVVGTVRVCWPVGLAFITPGPPGLLLVLALQTGLVTCMGVFNPVFATRRLTELPQDRIARTLVAWSVAQKLTTAALTALWGVLAAAAGPREAILAAGVLLLGCALVRPA